MSHISAARARSLGIRQCAACGQPFHRIALKAMQRYCGACSERSDLQRKKVAKRQAQGRSLGKSIGAGISQESARAISFSRPAPELQWTVRIAVPFTYAASKNHIYSLRASGHVVLRKESRGLKDLIAAQLAAALGDRRVAHNKVWLDILVQKSNHKGDAINVVDLVCDGVKRALPVDDRWFSIRSLDWEIVREGGSIFIGIGQETDQDAQVCSYCGQIKPLDAFHRKANGHLGIGRECKPCISAVRAARKTGVRIELEQAASVAARPAVPVGPSAGRVGELQSSSPPPSQETV